MNNTPNPKMSAQEYCLRWKYHHSNLQQMFSNLLERESYTDVTLACEGKTLRAHKMVLSACSTYFDSIFSEYSEKNPIVILKDVKYMDMKSLVNFMYRGEINVQNSHLSSLLKTAEDLRIKGLAQMSWPADGPGNDQIKEETKGNGSDGQWKQRTSDDGSASQVSVSNGSESPASKRKRPNSYSPKIANESGEEQSHWDQDDSEPEIISNPDPLASDDRGYGNMMPHNTSQETFNDHEADTGYNNTGDVHDSQPTIEPVAPPPPPPPPPTSSNAPLSERFRDVVKMNDYLVSGRRPQFWEEGFTRNVMEAIRNKEIEMKAGAEILGVSYGTLYGRYREAFGCLKHPYRVRDFWSEPGPAGVLGKLQRKEITLFRAAEILNVTVATLANYLSTLRQEEASPYTLRDTLLMDDGNRDGMLMGHMEDSYIPHHQLIKQEAHIGMGVTDDDLDPENSHGAV
ncbi:protein tramtrack, beta isoform-like [Frankliniella occidentalis]|uniref:Protein tramtrack, beta isoform-like n=1 Tax=Frankliniella occidentalis TaxID=133901 RepID=A0A6J1S2X3_FRAOC|nr:protein tramtrack, beta isoform-like [Frankliniella occidentalis]XP_026275352.1 protein tramtrack, beta isoform-like [Frankliniella occidentalis]XP_026275353.1 protein tramtrack, beta isoform-like [Frankliniella occidentalis]